MARNVNAMTSPCTVADCVNTQPGQPASRPGGQDHADRNDRLGPEPFQAPVADEVRRDHDTGDEGQEG